MHPCERPAVTILYSLFHGPSQMDYTWSASHIWRTRTNRLLNYQRDSPINPETFAPCSPALCMAFTLRVHLQANLEGMCWKVHDTHPKKLSHSGPNNPLINFLEQKIWICWPLPLCRAGREWTQAEELRNGGTHKPLSKYSSRRNNHTSTGLQAVTILHYIYSFSSRLYPKWPDTMGRSLCGRLGNSLY